MEELLTRRSEVDMVVAYHRLSAFDPVMLTGPVSSFAETGQNH
jgi:hypothetical protein